MKISLSLYAIVGSLVVAFLLGLFLREDRVEYKTKVETIIDTTIRIDTFVVEKPVVKTKKVIEEKIIYVHDTVKVVIPISEYRFFQDGIYDITARGYDVSLSNVTVYPKTIYQTITNESTTTITKYRSSLFVNAGFSSICGDFYPKVGLGLSLKGKWLISGDLGLYEKNPIYGISVGYNVLQK